MVCTPENGPGVKEASVLNLASLAEDLPRTQPGQDTGAPIAPAYKGALLPGTSKPRLCLSILTGCLWIDSVQSGISWGSECMIKCLRSMQRVQGRPAGMRTPAGRRGTPLQTCHRSRSCQVMLLLCETVLLWPRNAVRVVTCAPATPQALLLTGPTTLRSPAPPV
jgi:hypothetical protein